MANEQVEQVEQKQETQTDFRLEKYKYSLKTSSSEQEQNGAIRVENETLSINIENMQLDDAVEDIKKLIKQGYGVEMTLKVKE